MKDQRVSKVDIQIFEPRIAKWEISMFKSKNVMERVIAKKSKNNFTVKTSDLQTVLTKIPLRGITEITCNAKDAPIRNCFSIRYGNENHYFQADDADQRAALIWTFLRRVDFQEVHIHDIKIRFGDLTERFDAQQPNPWDIESKAHTESETIMFNPRSGADSVAKRITDRESILFSKVDEETKIKKQEEERLRIQREQEEKERQKQLELQREKEGIEREKKGKRREEERLQDLQKCIEEKRKEAECRKLQELERIQHRTEWEEKQCRKLYEQRVEPLRKQRDTRCKPRDASPRRRHRFRNGSSLHCSSSSPHKPAPVVDIDHFERLHGALSLDRQQTFQNLKYKLAEHTIFAERLDRELKDLHCKAIQRDFQRKMRKIYGGTQPTKEFEKRVDQICKGEVNQFCVETENCQDCVEPKDCQNCPGTEECCKLIRLSCGTSVPMCTPKTMESEYPCVTDTPKEHLYTEWNQPKDEVNIASLNPMQMDPCNVPEFDYKQLRRCIETESNCEPCTDIENESVDSCTDAISIGCRKTKKYQTEHCDDERISGECRREIENQRQTIRKLGEEMAALKEILRCKPVETMDRNKENSDCDKDDGRRSVRWEKRSDQEESEIEVAYRDCRPRRIRRSPCFPSNPRSPSPEFDCNAERYKSKDNCAKYRDRVEFTRCRTPNKNSVNDLDELTRTLNDEMAELKKMQSLQCHDCHPINNKKVTWGMEQHLPQKTFSFEDDCSPKKDKNLRYSMKHPQELIAEIAQIKQERLHRGKFAKESTSHCKPVVHREDIPCDESRYKVENCENIIRQLQEEMDELGGMLRFKKTDPKCFRHSILKSPSDIPTERHHREYDAPQRLETTGSPYSDSQNLVEAQQIYLDTILGQKNEQRIPSSSKDKYVTCDQTLSLQERERQQMEKKRESLESVLKLADKFLLKNKTSEKLKKVKKYETKQQFDVDLAVQALQSQIDKLTYTNEAIGRKCPGADVPKICMSAKDKYRRTSMTAIAPDHCYSIPKDKHDTVFRKLQTDCLMEKLLMLRKLREDPGRTDSKELQLLIDTTDMLRKRDKTKVQCAKQGNHKPRVVPLASWKSKY